MWKICSCGIRGVGTFFHLWPIVHVVTCWPWSRDPRVCPVSLLLIHRWLLLLLLLLLLNLALILLLLLLLFLLLLLLLLQFSFCYDAMSGSRHENTWPMQPKHFTINGHNFLWLKLSKIYKNLFFIFISRNIFFNEQHISSSTNKLLKIVR